MANCHNSNSAKNANAKTVPSSARKQPESAEVQNLRVMAFVTITTTIVPVLGMVAIAARKIPVRITNTVRYASALPKTKKEH